MKKNRKIKNCYSDRKTSYHGKNDVIVDTKISRIDFVNQPVGREDTLKSVFYCNSYYAPKGRMCILYGYTTIKVGDDIQMHGFYSDGVFIARSLMIKARNKDSENDNQTNN